MDLSEDEVIFTGHKNKPRNKKAAAITDEQTPAVRSRINLRASTVIKPGEILFGRYPPEEIITFMERNAKSWIASDRIYQSEDSTLCGYYCILFLACKTNRFFEKMRSCDFVSNQSKIKSMFT